MTRLSPQQLEQVQIRAEQFQKKLVLRAKGRGDSRSTEGSVFFATLFRLAAETIEDDVESFCDLAERLFEEIEAHGQEPQLDGDWLGEIVGDRDTFNFSTDNLVSDLVSLPRKKRRQKVLSQDEQDRLRKEVENAILDEGEEQNLQQALAVAHGENVNDWIEKIRMALQESESGVLEFWTIRRKAGLIPAELLLGILLGQHHWIIEQRVFYGEVLVRMRGEGRRVKQSAHGKQE